MIGEMDACQKEREKRGKRKKKENFSLWLSLSIYLHVILIHDEMMKYIRLKLHLTDFIFKYRSIFMMT
jgi:hypothetical protein